MKMNPKLVRAAWPFVCKDKYRTKLLGLRVEPHPNGGALLIATDAVTLACFYDRECDAKTPVTVGRDGKPIGDQNFPTEVVMTRLDLPHDGKVGDLNPAYLRRVLKCMKHLGVTSAIRLRGNGARKPVFIQSEWQDACWLIMPMNWCDFDRTPGFLAPILGNEIMTRAFGPVLTPAHAKGGAA